ncbi:hypothetical protein VTG60DRAFT_1129 [Thermothelomyces hinnuleus]
MRKQKPKTKPDPEAKPSSTTAAADDSSSELSSVIDEPPPPKRKRNPKKPAGKQSTSAAADSPDEAQIKLLQSQLNKCGVRKIWAVEFKKHGADTPKAKIKHLKQMLADVGMTGRFSEARAREIREMRELQADLQDVIQGEKSWGVGGGGRGTRRRAAAQAAGRGMRVNESEGSGGDESEEGGGSEGKGGSGEGSDDEDERRPAVRKKGPAKRRADLAFLDGESESD